MPPVAARGELSHPCHMADVFTVEQFMRFALYHPEVGYYAKHVERIGRGGDFSTAPTLSPLLGKAIARWILGRRCHRLLRPWHVIEIGGGDGSLAASIHDALPLLARTMMRYHMVEVSAPLRALQARRLKGISFIWHETMDGALAASAGGAVVIGNEVVDAFPATQWAWCTDHWSEVGVRLGEGQPSEVYLEPAFDRASRWCPHRIKQPVHPADGDRIEMHLSYAEWFSDWAPALKRGRILFIDYGSVSPPPRPGGSIRAYWRHQTLRGTDVYLRPGRQDLTADVDFAALRDWGEMNGLLTEWTGSQADFIRRWAGDLVRSPAAEFVTDVTGAGEAFRVLEQHPSAVS